MTNYASISRRIGAMLIDFLIIGFASLVINQALPIVGPLLLMALYAPIFESSEARATLGKHAMGVQVSDLSGRRITFQAALIRFGMKLVSSSLMFLGHFFAFFTEKHQALHDLVAETVVVYGRSEKPLADAWLEQIRAIFRAANLTSSGGDTAKPKSRVDELERLQALREKGTLTEEEFQREKARILSH